MAICKSCWLYLTDDEVREWMLGDNVWLRFVKVRDTRSDWVLMSCDFPRTGPTYQKLKGSRIHFDWLDDGTYEVREHTPNSIYLAWVSKSTEKPKKEKQPEIDPSEPVFDLESATVAEAREWLIWREFKLLKNGRVPQGWASVSAAFLDKIKERDKDRHENPRQSLLTNGTEPKKDTTEIDLLYEIINSTATPKDRRAAQKRLNEIQKENGDSDSGYNPQPVLVEVPDA